MKWSLEVSFLIQFYVVTHYAVIGNLLERHIGKGLAVYEVLLECLVELTLAANLVQIRSSLQIILSCLSNVLCQRRFAHAW